MGSDPPPPPTRPTDRRVFLAALGAAGASAANLPGALWAGAAAAGRLSREELAAAERVAGLTLTEGERELMLDGVNGFLAQYDAVRALEIGNEIPPALHFDPGPAPAAGGGGGAVEGAPAPERAAGLPAGAVRRPDDEDHLAHLPIVDLARLLRSRQVTSAALTELYLRRLERFDPLLHCVVSLTPDRARDEAARADAELDAGRWRGPLHGIPWGAKDLFSARGAPTTWGATPFREQRIDEDASVVRRLGEAGAVLVAKLSLGALAMGDVWFRGTTRNPWNLEQGSSGSSAGSAAAVVAGLVGFALGSETLGSIVSPCTRCGASGLRPTFGAVSRHGAMALAWSMDKVGPIGRSAEDCALVFDAIRGPDGLDPSVVERPFRWDRGADPAALRVGFTPELFEADRGRWGGQWRRHDLQALDTLRLLGIDLRPVELPRFPASALTTILNAEAAAAFDGLTRGGGDDELVRQGRGAWPNAFRQARMIPAVEYIQANRARTLLMREMAARTADLDAYLAPTFGGGNLLITNLTGHPCAVLPNGFRRDGTPTSLTITGALGAEDKVLLLAHAFQQATSFHRQWPALRQP